MQVRDLASESSATANIHAAATLLAGLPSLRSTFAEVEALKVQISHAYCHGHRAVLLRPCCHHLYHLMLQQMKAHDRQTAESPAVSTMDVYHFTDMFSTAKQLLAVFSCPYCP